jgi:tRNA-2-methylthio-N6-dimethylallyladenosine synthase
VSKKSNNTFYIETYGCQANEADSDRLGRLLEKLGFMKVNSPESAGIFIINSCAVRQKSEDKVYGLGKAVKNMESRPFIILSGCVVGSAKGDRVRSSFGSLRRKTPWVDLYLSPEEIMDLPHHLSLAGFTLKNEASVDGGVLISDRGYVNISYGCDNFCTYCVVPYARGKEISRPSEEILREVEALVYKGIKDITLCGQNVNSWGLSPKEKAEVRIGEDRKLPFARLLRQVHEIAGIENLSFMSSNPFDFTEDLLQTLKLPKISDYMHIAVQSGNNDVLRRMNRRHTIEEFVELLRQIKEVRPDMTFGTDVIVGFPGETREQFMDTVALFQKIKFNVAFIAMYSPRPGTAAARLYKDDVPREEKKYRHAYLTKAWRDSLK